jgi:hypothetical protein
MILMGLGHPTTGSSTMLTLASTPAITARSPFKLSIEDRTDESRSGNNISVPRPFSNPLSTIQKISSSWKDTYGRTDELRRTTAVTPFRKLHESSLSVSHGDVHPHYAIQKQCSRLDSNQRLCITKHPLCAGPPQVELGADLFDRFCLYSVIAARPLERGLVEE